MTKTNLFAAIAFIASTSAMTGCAIDSAEPCEIDTACTLDESAYGQDVGLEIEPNEPPDAVTAQQVRDPHLRQVPHTIPILQDWVLRIDAGVADDCDLALLGFVAGEDRALELEECRSSIVAELLAPNDGRPVAVALESFNAKETKWLLLGLDVQNDTPLNVAGERMLAEADRASLARMRNIEAEAVNEVEPRFAPEHVAPQNM